MAGAGAPATLDEGAMAARLAAVLAHGPVELRAELVAFANLLLRDVGLALVDLEDSRKDGKPLN